MTAFTPVTAFAANGAIGIGGRTGANAGVRAATWRTTGRAAMIVPTTGVINAFVVSAAGTTGGRRSANAAG